MKDILAEIVAEKYEVVAAAKRAVPLRELQEKAQADMGNFAMANRLKAKPWNLIAECKLQSPSKGNFGHRHTVAELAVMYEKAGAAMLSVHTDAHFLGKNADIAMVRQLVDLPILRKEFIIDAYQIYEARTLGADAILLIARLLTLPQLQEYLHIANSLGMDALVEVHDAEDMAKALATSARFIGINNRNLKYFRTDIKNTLELLPLADRSRVLISESGIHTLEEAAMLYEAGVNGILVGEGLATAEDVTAKTRSFVNINKKSDR